MTRFKGSNLVEVKKRNRAAILKAVHQTGGLSRVALAKTIGISKGGMTPLIDELISLNLIQETHTEQTSRGRKPTRLELCENRCHVIAINWTRSDISAALVDLTGSVLFYSSQPITLLDPLEKVIDIIFEMAQSIIEQTQDRTVIGVSIVAPGPLDAENGIILNTPNFGSWNNVPIADILSEKLKMTVFLENSANAHALAEKSYGLGKIYDSFVHLVVDEGIGGGIIVNGELFRGSHGLGGEIGHTTLDTEGRKCPCGNRGCVEMYASVPALVEAVQKCKKDKELTWDDILLLYHKGDECCVKAFEQEAEYLGNLLVSLVNVIAPEAVILGSKITAAGNHLLDGINQVLAQKCFYHSLRQLPVVHSQLQYPSLRGGAVRIFDAFIDGAFGTYESILS